MRIDCKFSWSANNLSAWFKTWTISFDLITQKKQFSFHNNNNNNNNYYFIWIEIAWCFNPSHEWRQWDIFIIAKYMYGIFARYCWPITYISWTIAIIITFNTCLRWAFDWETLTKRENEISDSNKWKDKKKHSFHAFLFKASRQTRYTY